MHQQIEAKNIDKNIEKLPPVLMQEISYFLPHIYFISINHSWYNITQNCGYWEKRIRNRFPELIAPETHDVDTLKRIYRNLQEHWHAQMRTMEDKEVKKIKDFDDRGGMRFFSWLTVSQLRALNDECCGILERPADAIGWYWYKPTPAPSPPSSCLLIA